MGPRPARGPRQGVTVQKTQPTAPLLLDGWALLPGGVLRGTDILVEAGRISRVTWPLSACPSGGEDRRSSPAGSAESRDKRSFVGCGLTPAADVRIIDAADPLVDSRSP